MLPSDWISHATQVNMSNAFPPDDEAWEQNEHTGEGLLVLM